MKFLKKFFCNVFAKPTLSEGDYEATVTDIVVKAQKSKHLPIVIIKYNLTHIETGEKFAYKETFIDNIFLLRCRDFVWFFESSGIEFNSYFDIVGVTLNITLIYDCIYGRKVPTIVYNDVLSPPPTTFIT